MRKLSIAAAAVLAMAAFAMPAAAQSTGTVTVLHGVPGLTVDVYANGDELIPNFEPGSKFGPADLPAGDYELAVRPAGAAADSEPAISGSATLPAGANASIVAHLTADGTPTLSVFVNDTSEIDAGQARLVVRHTAAFGAVDVLAGGNAIFEGVTNPNEGTVEVAAGSYDVAVTAAGDPATTAFSGPLSLEAGTAYLVHAIGDPSADTFDLLVQTIGGLDTEVLGVSTGSGGLAAEDGGMPWARTGAIVGALVILGLSSMALARSRS